MDARRAFFTQLLPQQQRPRVTFSEDTNKNYKDRNGYCPWVMEADEEAPPRDPGVIRPPPRAFTANDFEGHRAHTMYVGVHLPGEKRHRKHKHSRANSRDSDEEDRPITPPAQRVQFILGEDADNHPHEVHPLFSEMEELFREDDCLEWRETARWIKFEEDVEEGGNRWSKPHVATLSLHSLFELRSLLLNGTVVLDMEAVTLEQVADLTLDHVVGSGALHEDNREKMRDILLQRHRHLHERRKESNMRGLPIIRSLADIGRSHSSSKNMEKCGSARSLASAGSLPTPLEPFPVTGTATTGQRFLTVPGACEVL